MRRFGFLVAEIYNMLSKKGSKKLTAEDFIGPPPEREDAGKNKNPASSSAPKKSKAGPESR